MNTQHARQPKGAPNGGQFAASRHDEAPGGLDVRDNASALRSGPTQLRVTGADTENPSATIRRSGDTFIAETPGGPLMMRLTEYTSGRGLTMGWDGRLVVDGGDYSCGMATIFESNGAPGDVGWDGLDRVFASGGASAQVREEVRQWVADASAQAVAHPDFPEIRRAARRRAARRRAAGRGERFYARRLAEARDELADIVEEAERSIAAIEAKRADEERIATGGEIDWSTPWGS